MLTLHRNMYAPILKCHLTIKIYVLLSSFLVNNILSATVLVKIFFSDNTKIISWLLSRIRPFNSQGTKGTNASPKSAFTFNKNSLHQGMSKTKQCNCQAHVNIEQWLIYGCRGVKKLKVKGIFRELFNLNQMYLAVYYIKMLIY